MLQESDRDELLMTLVDAAREQPPESRAGYLRSACGGDHALRAEVEDRVEWEERMGGFLSDTAFTDFEFLGCPFRPGEVAAGRFRIIREVGQGGMGVVYEAFDQKLKRRVAIKSAHPGYGHRLPPEARAAREVSHFNVCKVYDLHSAKTEIGEVEFLSMEFIDGETLSARIKREGPLAPGEAMNVALQVCAGLAQAHRRSGRRREALQILDRLGQSKSFVPAPTLAIAYAGLNEKERAIHLLESGYASRDPMLQYMNVEGHFDSIKDDRRFRDLAAKIGLP